MRKLTVLISLTFFALVVFGQPVPELLFKRTQPNPAFISVGGLDMDIVDDQDYLFAYTSDMRCAGANKVAGENTHLIAYGQDAWDYGFKYREPISIGLYDYQTKKFYKLKGDVSGWSGRNSDLIWMSLNLIRYDVTGIDGEITLAVDSATIQEFYEVKLVITGDETWNVDTQNEKYFFWLTAKNIKDYTVTVSQEGELRKTKRWWKDRWYNYTYEPADHVENVTITATGTNRINGDLVQTQKLVQIERNAEPEPEPEPEVTIIAENEYVKAYIKYLPRPRLFIDNKTSEQITYYFLLYRDHDRYTKAMNKGTLEADESKGVMYLSRYNAVELQRIIANNKFVHINQKVDL